MGQQPPYRPNTGTGSPAEPYGYGRPRATPPLHHPVGRAAPAPSPAAPPSPAVPPAVPPAPAPARAAVPARAAARRSELPDTGPPARRTAARARSRAGDDERDVLGMVVRGTVAAVVGMFAAGVMVFVFFALWALLSG